jgi:hypothetical protein
MKTIINYCVFALSIILLIVRCGDKYEKKCNPDFFERVNGDTTDLKLVFKLGNPFTTNGKCEYPHEFLFWRGGVINNKPIPYIHLKGNIYKLGGAIYFELDSGNTFKYFDFDMAIGQSQPITFFRYLYDDYSKKNIRMDKNYDLVLEDKFLDNSIQDTVYKFRFSNIEIQLEETDVVFYMSQHYGLVGAYHTNLLKDGTEEVFSSVGNVYNEINKKYMRSPSKGNIL